MELVLTTAITSSSLVMISFIFQQVYGCIYDYHSMVPFFAIQSYGITTALLNFIISALLLVTPPIDFIRSNWPGLIYPVYFVDLGYTLYNRKVYRKKELIFTVSQKIIRIILATILLLLQIGAIRQIVVPWYLLWDFSSLVFSFYRIWLGNHKIQFDPVSYYQIYLRQISAMVLQNTLRLAVYPLLYVFNTGDLATAGVAFGLIVVLHLFELFVEIKDSIYIYRRLVDSALPKNNA